MCKYVQYNHHGTMVNVRENLKGLHREYCICYDCKKFNVAREENCKISNLIFALCVACGVTTPIWECPHFVEKV